MSDTILRKLASLHGRDKLEFIRDTLQCDFNYQILPNKMLNLYMTKYFGSDQSLLITAHHDVVNKDSMNVLDNNGSILNLMAIAKAIVNAEKCDYNIAIGFTDGEESCSIDQNGAVHLICALRYDYHLDFELTPNGKIPVITRYGNFPLFKNAVELKQPYNNAYATSSFLKSLRSACMTLVFEEDLEEINRRGYCTRWSNCHSINDDLRWYNNTDCESFVEMILSELNVS